MMMMISTIRATIFCNCFPCCSGFSDCLIPKHRHSFTTLPVYFYSIMLNLEHSIMNYFVISVMNDSWHLPDTQMVHKDKTPLTGWEEETTWQVFRIHMLFCTCSSLILLKVIFMICLAGDHGQLVQVWLSPRNVPSYLLTHSLSVLHLCLFPLLYILLLLRGKARLVTLWSLLWCKLVVIYYSLSCHSWLESQSKHWLCVFVSSFPGQPLEICCLWISVKAKNKN